MRHLMESAFSGLPSFSEFPLRSGPFPGQTLKHIFCYKKLLPCRYLYIPKALQQSGRDTRFRKRSCFAENGWFVDGLSVAA